MDSPAENNAGEMWGEFYQKNQTEGRRQEVGVRMGRLSKALDLVAAALRAAWAVGQQEIH
jgi:hypothetical protein